MSTDELDAAIREALIEAGQKIRAAVRQWCAGQVAASHLPAAGERRGEPAPEVAEDAIRWIEDGDHGPSQPRTWRCRIGRCPHRQQENPG